MELVPLIWLGLVIVFIVVEAACPIHLVSVWFAAGSLVAVAVALLDGPIWLQVLLFLVVSGGLLAALWPLTKRFLKPKLTATNVDSVIGSTGTVTADIDNVSASGQVKLGAMYWTARSTTGEMITKDTIVRVDRIEGVKVFVSPAQVKVNA